MFSRKEVVIRRINHRFNLPQVKKIKCQYLIGGAYLLYFILSFQSAEAILLISPQSSVLFPSFCLPFP